MPRTTQRVKFLKENFMHYHEIGYTIPEIAEKCAVDDSTVYYYLAEIAKANNVTRESLLTRASSSHVTSTASFHKDKVDIEQLNRDFQSLDTHLSNIISSLDQIINQI